MKNIKQGAGLLFLALTLIGALYVGGTTKSSTTNSVKLNSLYALAYAGPEGCISKPGQNIGYCATRVQDPNDYVCVDGTEVVKNCVSH